MASPTKITSSKKRNHPPLYNNFIYLFLGCTGCYKALANPEVIIQNFFAPLHIPLNKALKLFFVGIYPGKLGNSSIFCHNGLRNLLPQAVGRLHLIHYLLLQNRTVQIANCLVYEKMPHPAHWPHPINMAFSLLVLPGTCVTSKRT